MIIHWILVKEVREEKKEVLDFGGLLFHSQDTGIYSLY